MDILRMGTAAICAGAMALIGISHYSGEDAKPAPVFITMPASAPSASICEVKCPGYEEPDTSYHAAPRFLYEKPTVPTNGVVTVYVAAPVTAQSAPKATGQGKASTPKAKASSSKSSGTSKAPKATAAPKQTVPSTTVTTKTSVSTHSTAKGSTTTQSSSTTTTHKG